eukprot:CAMPEP_0183355514 /NCGR_PEP_ID=MMETSP0164_2-20130417/40728_1 /TAXON_ID=221442 /ORGANISM="Coccolithus pelagicus ssp braarudi, Strain PLY182g" /LENGTH=127 /DNA_ID=CAMNT_0025528643 /DNA_START=1010 /DNA_END=1390 /DNA_ORIENTATION=-
MVLDMPAAMYFDQVVPSIRLQERAAAEDVGDALAKPLERVRAVELLVLVPAMSAILIDTHQRIQRRQCTHCTNGANHLRLGGDTRHTHDVAPRRKSVDAIYALGHAGDKRVRGAEANDEDREAHHRF